MLVVHFGFPASFLSTLTLTFRRFRLWAGPWHGFFGRLGPFRGLAFLPVVLGVLVSILLGWRDVLLLDLLGLLDDLGLLGLGVHDLPLLGLLDVLGLSLIHI